MFLSSADQPVSPYKTIHIMRTHRKGAGAGSGINRPSISRPSENFVPPLNLHNNIGILQAPPPQVLLPPTSYNLFHSYPPFSMQQPPLLPLPISSTKPNKANINTIQHPPIMRGLSCPPPTTTNRKTHKKVARSRDLSLTPKKSKAISPTKEQSLKPLGPYPKHLPKDVPKALTLLSGSGSFCNSNTSSTNYPTREQVMIDRFSGPVAFTISPPPPSSLPLPTFSLRPKLSCNAEAAGVVDAGATDNLCRLLRLG